MFDINKYKENLEIIRKEEITNYNNKIANIEEYQKTYLERELKLNRDNNILFKHSLANAWRRPIEEFYIIDSNENNIIINNEEKSELYKYTINYDDIRNVKKLVAEITDEYDVLIPPILDGSSHIMYFFNNENGYEIRSFNIWYWMNEENFDDKYLNGKKEKIENTKKIINCIKELQKILLKNNIKYKIISDK